MKKTPFRLTPYQVQWLLVVGFVTVGYAIYIRYLAIEFSGTALACDAGLQSLLCKARALAPPLFRNSVFGITAVVIATLHLIRPSIVLLTLGLIAAIYTGFDEGPDNWQSLWTCAIYVLLGATLWRARAVQIPK